MLSPGGGGVSPSLLNFLVIHESLKAPKRGGGARLLIQGEKVGSTQPSYYIYLKTPGEEGGSNPTLVGQGVEGGGV